jgi:AcrR family transcriptional regulator
MSIVSDAGGEGRAPYHHGDLHRALIEAGLALLEEQHGWDFSLRELARRAGVSHNAPYKHFVDKRALMLALAQDGFERLRAVTEAAAVGATGSDAALVAIGVAYVRFGRSRPAHYRLMFGALLTDKACVPPEEVSAVALAARGVLRRVILEGIEAGRWDVAAEVLEQAVLAAWALVHGVTLLFLDGFIPVRDEAEADRLAAGVIGMQVKGLQRQLRVCG